jgi:hypothetical protein
VFSVKAAVQIARNLKSAPKAANSPTRIRCVAIANILRNATISVDKFYIYTYTTPHYIDNLLIILYIVF